MFSINRKDFLEALQIASYAIEARPQQSPILAHLLIKGKKDSLEITAEGPEMEITVEVNCKLESELECVVSARKLVAICQSLSEDATIDCTREDQSLQIKSGKNNFNINTLPVEDFPLMGELRAESTLRLPCADLSMLLERTHFSMAQQDTREYLQGLLMELGSEYLRTVATDGHRLALCEASMQLERTEALRVLLPRRTVERLLMRLVKKEGEITVEIGERHARFLLDKVCFSTRLIGAEYPDYQSVIPKPGKNLLNAECRLLQAALKRAATVLDDNQPRIDLTLESAQLKLNAENAQGERAEASIPVDYQGEEMTLGFNWIYLDQVLAKIGSERVRIYFIDGDSSCLLLPEEGENSKYVVMPMRR